MVLIYVLVSKTKQKFIVDRKLPLVVKVVVSSFLRSLIFSFSKIYGFSYLLKNLKNPQNFKISHLNFRAKSCQSFIRQFLARKLLLFRFQENIFEFSRQKSILELKQLRQFFLRKNSNETFWAIFNYCEFFSPF